MSTPVRVLAFLTGLVAVFGAAWGVGTAAEPMARVDTARHGHATPGDDHVAGPGEHEAADGAVTVRLDQRVLRPGPESRLVFTLTDAGGRSVTAYDVVHERPLHLIVLDTRSLTDFQHVHPRRTGPGTWSVELPLAAGTGYRLYADGRTHGRDFVATADFLTSGHHPVTGAVPAPSDSTRVAGYHVALERRAGTARLTVTRDGAPVPLQPYLGALGHLVVIRVDDLAYLHVHPAEGDSPTFAVAGLAAGSHRYFFDFKVGGEVHTVAFTVDQEPTASAVTTGEEPVHDDEH
jgi:hypothetical protein